MPDRLTELFTRFVDKTISPAEKRELSELSLLDENQDLVHNLIREAWNNQVDFEEMSSDTGNKILDKILKNSKGKIRLLWVRRIAVAAIMTGIIFGTYEIFFKKQEKTNLNPGIVRTIDIAPGTNKAILTLGNGSKIILDSAANGTLTTQGNTNIIKTDSGKLAYNTLNEKPTAIVYNTLSTPRGGQYELKLPDGTKVWLNAASSITYPTAFTGKERMVEVRGEVYFSVVHNAKMPFRAKVGDNTIEDIGTEFNINAYRDEDALRITLIDGAVDVIATANRRRLSPGEQAQLREGNLTVNKNVDIAKTIAWKRGLFEFNETSLPVIMRQISRWYDVDVKYEGPVSNETFGGGISRNLPLSDVLKLLEANGVKFRLEGKQLIVNYNQK